MELYDVMRATFAAREFTDAALPDAVLHDILDNARFAPSGGNRQGNRVIVVRDADTRGRIAALVEAPAKRYIAQIKAGESPWNTVVPSRVTAEEVANTTAPAMLTEPYIKAPVVLVFTVDLKAVAATDQDLDRIGVIGGASARPADAVGRFARATATAACQGFRTSSRTASDAPHCHAARS